jgi:hypothetical protein
MNINNKNEYDKAIKYISNNYNPYKWKKWIYKYIIISF